MEAAQILVYKYRQAWEGDWKLCRYLAFSYPTHFWMDL